MNRSLSFVAFAWLAPVAATLLPAQEGVPAPPGLVPEQMWPAPTAEDWSKPVQIQWQRTWDEAVLLSRQTQKPILVCVNMDGEIASEHYAGIRYRDPEIGKLYEPYICVIASVYRHNPTDYDEQGQRIPCPRLGGCTCGEHIAMEPIVFEKFLDGKRISPRHIMVELDGSETYDVFYTWDVQSVLTTLGDGIKNRKIQAPPVVKGDRSLLEKVASADSSDRNEVERAFVAGTAEQKKALLQGALALGERAPVELLRLAAYGLDPDLGRQARTGMLATKDPLAVELIADTLKAPLPQDERKQLVEALARFGASSPKARTLATAHQGLAQQSAVIDTGKWQSVLEGPAYTGASADDLAGTARDRDEALKKQPTDPAARLDVAEASLLQALAVTAGGGPGDVRQASRYRQMLLEDADREAMAAAAAGAKGWRADAVRAVSAFHRGRATEAYELAVAAAPGLPPEAPGPLAMELLALFAEARQEAIVAAVRAKKEWPGQWTTDVHAAYAVLGKHPFGRDQHVAHHYDFLQFFGTPEADAVLDRGLLRFPDSALLHERLRARILLQQTPEALELEYAGRLQAPEAPATLPWFAGFASLCAAESHRRKNAAEKALAAYARGIELFARYRTATAFTDGEHFVAVAHAGVARVKLLVGDLDGSFAALQASFAAAPKAAAAVDGLGTTGMQTVEMLRARATDSKRDDLVQKLDAARAALPAEAFELPDYERASRPAGRRRRG